MLSVSDFQSEHDIGMSRRMHNRFLARLRSTQQYWNNMRQTYVAIDVDLHVKQTHLGTQGSPPREIRLAIGSGACADRAGEQARFV